MKSEQKVLQQAHSQLYLSMRYLEGAFSAFSYEMRQETGIPLERMELSFIFIPAIWEDCISRKEFW